MDIFQTGDFFWMLALAVPILVVLLVLCTDCRDPDIDTPAIDDYQYKPSTNAHSQTFRLLRRPPSPPWSDIQYQLDSQRTDSEYRFEPAFIKIEDNESVPSYENEEIPCPTDDDENYNTGYIIPCQFIHSREVLPDVPITEQKNKDHGSSESIIDQYENVYESQRNSPNEYVNILEPKPSILDPCFVDTSDRESEDDIPDYENVCFGSREGDWNK
ncbi:linker for activation of T-cells family member 1 isoform X2 [Erythrolamprus reginae]|uniref:linker for activation of T-cells family member 1 isoform X2 n=1 Tax=Erythrolamprus reginae TaxID=121349 RepID=UPI00396C5E0D